MDRSQIEWGKSYQREARAALSREDFELALTLYDRAAGCFEAGYDGLGDRIFFMEASALRCLEELSEVNAYWSIIYRQRGRNFLEKWTVGVVDSSVTRQRRAEAHAFILWRKSYFNRSHGIVLANRAIDSEDWAEAAQHLDLLVSELEKSSNPNDLIIKAIAKTKQLLLPLRIELSKDPKRRDFPTMYRALLQASKKSFIPGLHDERGLRLLAFRHLHLSNALKFRAFEAIGAEGSPEQYLPLSSILLSRALRHAKKAADLGAPVGGHVPYLEYWKAIVTQRHDFIVFMLTGELEAIERARANWSRACTIAARATHLFPNRYYSLEDLELEGRFLEAASAFRNGEYPAALEHLEYLLEHYPRDFVWSWREMNLRVRLLGLRALNLVLQGDRSKVAEEVRAMRNLSQNEPIGDAARVFVETLVLLLSRYPSDDWKDLLPQLYRVFPLDSYVEHYESAEQLDTMRSYNRFVLRYLRVITDHQGASISRRRIAATALLEELIGTLVEYYARPEEPPQPASLLENAETLLAVSQKYRRELFTESLALVGQFLSDSSQNSFDNLVIRLHIFLKKVSSVTPIVTTVEAIDIGKHEAVTLPEWSIASRDRVMLRGVDVTTLVIGGRYYLSPGIRKGTQRVVPIAGTIPKALFTPRRLYWHDRDALASFEELESVRTDHMLLALDQMRLCKESTPAVGAVIVKDAQVLATGFRNEDGRGGHAEKCAISKCSHLDLEASTIITTLEPCMSDRTPGETPCAHLIIQHKIKSVVIGLIDPNQRIRGRADQLFRLNGIRVVYFPSTLAEQIWNFNKDWISGFTSSEFRQVYLYSRMEK